MRPLAVLTVFLAVSTLAATAAWACRCVRFPSAEAQLARADAMFVGRALDTHPTGETLYGEPLMATRFQVQRVIKGRVPDTLLIGNGVICGMTFTSGRRYTLLANRDSSGVLVSGGCDQPQFPLADYERAMRRGG